MNLVEIAAMQRRLMSVYMSLQNTLDKTVNLSPRYLRLLIIKQTSISLTTVKNRILFYTVERR